MALLRWLALPAVVASILIGFSFVNRPEDSLVDRLLAVRGAAAQQVSTGSAVPVAPTPTPFLAGSPTNSQPTSTSTIDGPPTQEPTSTPVPTLTGTPASNSSPTSGPTGVATDTASAATGTPNPSPTTTAIPTPTVDPSLPPLTVDADAPDTIAEGTVLAAGARVSTADGRVAVDFPAGAVSEPLDIKIKTLSKVDRVDPNDPSGLTIMTPAALPPPSPDQKLVDLWEFNASAIERGAAPVHSFNTNVRFTLRLGNDLLRQDPRSLRFWTYDDATSQWLPVPATINSTEVLLVGLANHFTVYSVTATDVTDLAPLLDGSSVDLHAGASTFSMPIELPPGRGGLAPKLELNYSSSRLGEMRTYVSSSSWVGAGWDLDVPNVQLSQDTTKLPTAPGEVRLFLSLGNGIGGEMMEDPSAQHDADGYVWRLRSDPFIKIRTACQAFYCPWTVWDQKGTQYFFPAGGTSGADKNSFRRFWLQDRWQGTQSIVVRDYRYDVQYMRDVLTNQINFTFAQDTTADPNDPTLGDSPALYVIDSYVQSIKYNGDQTEIDFTTGCDISRPAPRAGQPPICQRVDTPYDLSQQDCFSDCVPCTYVAPLVRETKKLNSIAVKNGGALVRQYTFAYPTDGDFRTVWCATVSGGGWHMLRSVSIGGRDGNVPAPPNAFTTTSFNYQWLANRFYSGNDIFTLSRPYLSEVDNPFGGKIQFAYQELDNHLYQFPSGFPWTREAVTVVTKIPTASQPAIVTNMTYNFDGWAHGGADYQARADPYNQNTYDFFNAEFRGYHLVSEETDGVVTTHRYYTTHPSSWQPEVLTGREIETIAGIGSDYTNLDKWSDIIHGWWWTPISNPRVAPGDYFVNFVYEFSRDAISRSGVETHTVNTYDATYLCASGCYGVPIQIDSKGDLYDTTHNAEVVTNTAYSANPSNGVVVPRYEEKLASATDAVVLACTRHYYDGASGPAANLPTPTAGLLTADSNAISTTTTRAQCESDAAFPNPNGTGGSTNAYFTYDPSGNRLRASVPTSIAPEDQSQGPQPSGWIPSGVASTSSTLDSTYANVLQVTNAAGQITNYDPIVQGQHTFDYVLGKPTRIEEANGHYTEIRYDMFGRVTTTWDNLDSQTNPTARYTYNWGTAGTSTTTSQKADAVLNTYRTAVSCVDGLGREVEHIENYDGTATSAVRTNYDSRGQKIDVTNAFDNSGSLICPNTYPSTATRDRTVYSYGPGTVATTMSVAGNATQPVGPRKTVSDTGTTKTSIDELFRRTLETTDITARTKTVTEPLPSVILRPSGQGYAQWSPGGVADFQNVNEAVTDDDGSQNNHVGVAKDTHTYPAASLSTGTIISSVIFHFRWKTSGSADASTDGVWPIFRKATTETRGPVLHHRASRDGWGDDEWQMVLNPLTNAAWQLSDFNTGSEFGFGFETSGPTTHPYVTQSWVEIVTGNPQTSNTVYQYDRLGRLTNVTDAAGNTTSLQYDLLGRKVDMQDPDMGHWTYAYDAAGNLTNQTDNLGSTTLLTYDASERLTAKAYSPNGIVAYAYDSYNSAACGLGSGGPSAQTGHLTRIQTLDGVMTTETPCYDVRGRVEIARTTVGSTYDVRTTFDALGQAKTITYPDGEVVTYGGSAQGDIRTMNAGGTTLLVNAVRAPWSAIASLTLGTLDTTTYGYDSRQRLQDIQTGSSIQHLHLSYDDASNITGVNDTTGSGDNVLYQYDQLNRVTGMSSNGTSTASYAYNQIGNLLTKSEGGATEALSYGSAAPNPPQPHAVTSTTGSSPNFVISYDKNGNLKTQGANTYAYDGANRLIQRPTAGGVTLTYDYGGDGSMLRKRGSDGSSTAYIGGIYEKNVTGGVTTFTKYYKALGRTIAMRVVPSIGGAGTLNYLLSDHLGSTTTTITNGLIATEKYFPFGATRATTGAVPTDKLFTGQQQEPGDSLGLYDYGARFYSTALGRFVSADPIAKDGLNRYAYALNRPTIAIDPSGFDALFACGLSNSCEHGGTAEEWRHHVIAYWVLTGVEFGPWNLEQAFDMLRYVMEDKDHRWDATQTLAAFKVGFMDTSNGPLGGLAHLAENSDLARYVKHLDDLIRDDAAIDTLVGFSEGGAVIMRWMAIQLIRDQIVPELSRRSQIKGVLLLQPGANQLGDPDLDANDFPGTIIVTRNGTHGFVWGTVAGAFNFSDDSCGGSLNHCNYDENFATSALDISLVLFGRWHFAN